MTREQVRYDRGSKSAMAREQVRYDTDQVRYEKGAVPL